MAQYGMIYDANSVKRQLYEANRGYNQRKTWEGMFVANDIQGQQLDAAATGAFSTAINQAFNASSKGNAAIMGSGLGQGFKNTLVNENEVALQQAYDTYSQNLATTRNQINENVYNNALAIDQAATEQAGYVKDYANAHFNYLDYLYSGYESGDNTLFDDKQWAKYLTDDVDSSGEVLGKRLLTREELMTPSFTLTEDGTKEWTSLYDDQGNLTVKGLDFFDQMQNQNVTANSFGSYLAGDAYKDESAADARRRQELLNWSQSYNPYDYTFAGTNKGTFKTMMGLSSMDNEYAFAERFGGFTKSEIDSMYNDFSNAVNELSTASKSAKSSTKEINNLITEVEKLATDLGIEADFNFDALKSEAEAYINATKTHGDLTGDWFGGVGGTTVGGAATGTGVGASVGSVVPVVGTGLGAAVGVAVGTTIGLIGGIIKSSIDVSKAKKKNTEMAKQSKEMYMELLNNMVNYSMAKQKQAQIDFSKQINQF